MLALSPPARTPDRTLCPRPAASRRAAAALALAACATLAAGCRGGDAAPNRDGFVDSRDEYDPRTLDPALATDVPTGRVVSYVFDGLTRFTPDARVAPGLATRWEVSPDGRVYTFHLRPGVRFHDGTPLLARHVVASWARALGPSIKGGNKLPLFPIQGARAVADGRAPALAGARALDDSTVQVTLDTALAIFPKLLAMPVASVVAPNAGADFGQHPVGTGPWRFVEWKHDDYLRFARNPGYWGGTPGVDTLTARIIPEPSTAVAEFENGTVDVLAVPEGETRAWEQTDERQARLQSAPALRLYYVAINTTRGPLADVRVRQALNLAVDKKAILDRLVAGRGVRASGVIPGALDSLADDRAPYPYDPARARQLLADAGFPNGIDVQLWSSQQPTVARMAQAIQGYLKAANVRATLVQRDAPSVREAARNGQVDLVVKDWFADYPDADAFLTPLLASTSRGVGGNLSFYANKCVDSLITLARRTADDQQRAALSRQADSAAFADAPLLYLFHYNVLYATQPWLRNFQVPVIYNGQRWLGVSVDHNNGAAAAPPPPAPASSGAASSGAASSGAAAGGAPGGAR
ncbi:peptide ABC transporter substrate-binding protein [Gemmatimonadetes bacterium T265]|nr:peptide ABC transporter substrate-binding protein [Gemmatimonadetes bacterium T265]